VIGSVREAGKDGTGRGIPKAGENLRNRKKLHNMA